MCSSVGAIRTFFFVILFLACFALWVLHSLPIVFRFLDGADHKTEKRLSLDQMSLPVLVICSKLPYTKAGLNSLGSIVNQDFVLQYLREWLDPSMVQSPDYVAMSSQEMRLAESTISQLLPNAGLKERLSQIVIQCQDFISSCAYGGVTMSGFECCRQVEPFLATLNGICWTFKLNQTNMQSTIGYPQGLQITFQIARNSFLSSYLSSHPGLEIYLEPQDIRDRIRFATELQNPYYLKDKKSLRVLVTKEILSDLKKGECGRTTGEAFASDKKMRNSSYVPCLVDAAVRECNCVPLAAVLWTLQGDLDSSFLRRFNVSSICTVAEYNRCALKYMDYARPKKWLYKIPSAYADLKQAVDNCRRIAHVPCQRSVYHTTDHYSNDLPQEYQSTQDFVSRFSIDYDSLIVVETSEGKDTDIWQMITLIGYNLATWFAIGHLIWSALHLLGNKFCQHTSNNKVEPKQPMIISSPIMRSARQLPPLEITSTAIDPNSRNVRNGNNHRNSLNSTEEGPAAAS